MAQVVNISADALIKAAATVAEHLSGAARPPAGARPLRVRYRRPTRQPHNRQQPSGPGSLRRQPNWRAKARGCTA
jgi:hypothetical protein